MAEWGFAALRIDQSITIEIGGPSFETGGIAGDGFCAFLAHAGADAGDHLGRFKGFDDVIICAQFQSRDAILDLCTTRNDDHHRPLF